MTDITHPFLTEYAKQCGADFFILDQPPEQDVIEGGKHLPHYRIMKLYDILADYERVLSIDSDILINNGCPNIFDVVPETHIGYVVEDVGTRRGKRIKLIQQIQKAWGNVGWEHGYMNGGVLVVSKGHRNIFTSHQGKFWMGWASVQTHINYLIYKHKHPVFHLPFQWNHMTMFSEKWNKRADRFDSYIIHYAGSGGFEVKKRINQIEIDAKKIRSLGNAQK